MKVLVVELPGLEPGISACKAEVLANYTITPKNNLDSLIYSYMLINTLLRDSTIVNYWNTFRSSPYQSVFVLLRDSLLLNYQS